MMANTIYGLSNYYNTLISPVKNYEVNPVTNLIYGGTMNKLYSKTFANKIQSEMSSYLSSMNSNVNSVKNSAKSLITSNPNSTFNKKAVVSSNSAAITGTAAPNANEANYTLNISKLAKSQVNTGTQIKSNENTSFATGVNTISLKVGNNEARNISFVVNEGDTNKVSLENMAKAINYAKVGVSANIISNNDTGESYLKLTSDKTGADNSFTVSDIKGNAANASGINTITQNAQNAEYTVNGEKHISEENTVNLENNKVQLTFNKADGKDIKVNINRDVNAIKSDIKNFVESYNKTINFTETYAENFSGANQIKQEFAGGVRSRRYSLEGIGITQNSNGTLSVNEEKLKNSIETNASKVEDILGGINGVAKNIYNKSSEILTSPLKYTKPQEIDKSYDSFYKYTIAMNRLTKTPNQMPGLVLDMLL